MNMTGPTRGVEWKAQLRWIVTFGLNVRLDLSREATTLSLCSLRTKLKL